MKCLWTKQDQEAKIKGDLGASAVEDTTCPACKGTGSYTSDMRSGNQRDGRKRYIAKTILCKQCKGTGKKNRKEISPK